MTLRTARQAIDIAGAIVARSPTGCARHNGHGEPDVFSTSLTNRGQLWRMLKEIPAKSATTGIR